MGVVYRAYDPRLKRNVALKLVAPELAADPRFRERFLAESELAASLEHPNVVPIHGAGEVDGQLYLAMRYVVGSDLKTLLAEEGPFEPKRALTICGQIADALDAAHERGLVHRDVKPSNVLLDEAEHVYLADFGLTRRISEGGGLGPSLGTPAYAAPEQIQGAEVDGRADVYSLGCLLYECLAGQVPFPRDSELAALWAHLNDPPPKLAAYPALDTVIAKALAKDPEERYPSCRALVEAAAQALGVRDVVLVRDRRPLLVALVGLLLAGGAAAAAVLLSQGGGPPKPTTKPTIAPKGDSLQRIDPRTNKLAATIKVGSNPSGVAVGEGAVWVTNENDGTLSRIDPKTDRVSLSSVAGADPTHVAAGEGSVWVSNGNDGTLARLDPRTLKIVHTFPAGGSYCGPVAVGEGAVWVVAGNTLVRVSPEDNLTARIAGLPECAKDVAVGGGAVWLAAYLSRTVTRVDPIELKAVTSIPLAFLPADIAADRQAVWVVNNPDDSVVRIDPETNRILGRVRVGDGPSAVAVGEGGVWTANLDDGTVSRIDPKTGAVVATIRVGPRPTDIAAGQGGVWVVAHAQ
jgi:YVTN family beta-propeller protein